MKKNYLSKFGVVLSLFLFFMSSAMAMLPSGKKDPNIEFNSFLGVVRIPEGYETECECGKLDGSFCHKKLNYKYCMYINKLTNEQFIVDLECAKSKFDLSGKDVCIVDCGINTNFSASFDFKTENITKFPCIKVLKYFFNKNNWAKTDYGFAINLENLYKILGLNCDEKNLNIIETAGTSRFKIDYLNKDFFAPSFSVSEENEGDEKFIVEVYVAYDNFCRLNGIENIYQYHNIRFDNNLNTVRKYNSDLLINLNLKF